MAGRSPAVHGWQHCVDRLLAREVVRWRTVAGVPPRDLAGCVVTDADVDRLLAQLPDLGDPAGRAGTESDAGAADGLTDGLTAEFTGALAGDSRFAAVVRRLGLGPRGALALAVAAAVELDAGRQQIVAYLNDDVRRPRPSLGLYDRVGLLDELAPDAALVRSGLVEVDTDGPFMSRQVATPPRVCWHLLGADAADPDLPADLTVVAAPTPTDTGPTVTGASDPGRPMPIVVGADRFSRRDAARRALDGQPMLVVAAPLDRAAERAVVREAVLTGSSVLLECDGPLPPATRAWLEALPVPCALASPTEIALPELPRRAWRELALTSGLAGPQDWHALVGDGPVPDHRLDREQLHWVAVAVRGGPGGQAVAAPAAVIDAGVRRLASGVLDRLAIRIEPQRDWDDLVLPDDQRDQLREITQRHRHRGRVHLDWGFSEQGGTVALFAGPSGTGKTMAAEVIAGALGLDLYRVDLGSVVSKYIGETEKNLDRVFDAARAAAAVLLFDEADALFGKRTEVSDAHDRYANLEVSYLLQRLEAHDGCVILTTNLKRNIDEAFVRRLSATVDFPAPGPDLRRALWRGSLPAEAPVGPIDLDFLAERFDVTGGMIHNAAVAAAFLAADDGGVIEMTHLVRAMRRELQKAGRLQSEVDFGPYLPPRGTDRKEVDRAQPVGQLAAGVPARDGAGVGR